MPEHRKKSGPTRSEQSRPHQTRSHQSRPDAGQPDIVDELRRRDQPVVDAPATVPHPSEEVEPAGSQPPEDGGVPQHPIHDSDIEDLGPEDYEEMTDEVAKSGRKRTR